MSNHLIKVAVSPSSINSGGATQAAVEYESDTGGPLLLSSGSGFTVQPASQTLPATPSGVHNVTLTITRGAAQTKNCRVALTFFESKREVMVEVK